MYEFESDRILYNGKRLKADIDSFDELAYEFAQDRDSIYFKGKVQEQIDRQSFRMLDEFFVADNTAVYLVSGDTLKSFEAEPSSFWALGFGYARDSQTGYWMDRALPSRPDILYPFGEDLALDDQGVFWQDRRVLETPLNRRSAKAYKSDEGFYFGDESGVWHFQGDGQVKKLDIDSPESYRVLGGEEVTDGDSRILRGEKTS